LGDKPRNIFINRERYDRGFKKYGFAEKKLDENGWLVSPEFLDCETIAFPVKANVVGWNSITTGRGPNNKWTYGMNTAASTSGSGCRLSVFGRPHATRNLSLKAALEAFIAWHKQVNDPKTAPVVRQASDMLDELSGRKPVQMSLFMIA
jgi:hypothetical protein